MENNKTESFEKKTLKPLYIPDGMKQEFFEKTADFLTDKYTAPYHLFELITAFRSLDMEDKHLKLYWGKDYEKKVKQLELFCKYAPDISIYFIGTDNENKISINKLLKSPEFSRAVRAYKRVNSLRLVASEAYCILLRSSNMKDFACPNECLARRGIYVTTKKKKLPTSKGAVPEVTDVSEKKKV